MFLIAGLGNPGAQYHNTRHNFGAMLADQLASYYNFSNKTNKFSSIICEGHIDNQKILLIQPTTFMNLSGIAVSKAMNFYKIPLNQVIILHDELDLALERVKVKVGGGNAGHNGLKDIDKHIGINYTRIRLGIAREKMPNNTSNFVLSKFNNDEMVGVVEVMDKICELFPLILQNNHQDFMNKFAL